MFIAILPKVYYNTASVTYYDSTFSRRKQENDKFARFLALSRWGTYGVGALQTRQGRWWLPPYFFVYSDATVEVLIHIQKITASNRCCLPLFRTFTYFSIYTQILVKYHSIDSNNGCIAPKNQHIGSALYPITLK